MEGTSHVTTTPPSSLITVGRFSCLHRKILSLGWAVLDDLLDESGHKARRKYDVAEGPDALETLKEDGLHPKGRVQQRSRCPLGKDGLHRGLARYASNRSLAERNASVEMFRIRVWVFDVCWSRLRS